MLDLGMRKIKGTPYNVVLSGWEIIGIFDRKKFFSLKGMSAAHHKAANEWHASTFAERLARPQGV